MGNITATAIITIFGVSSMPNQMMNSGNRPMMGTVRRICTFESMRSSPRRNSPATTASTIPIVMTHASPSATRWTETHNASGSDPSRIISQPVRRTVPGPASVFSSRRPVAEANHQRPMSSAGPSSRRTARGQLVGAARRAHWRQPVATWAALSWRVEYMASGLVVSKRGEFLTYWVRNQQHAVSDQQCQHVKYDSTRDNSTMEK